MSTTKTDPQEKLQRENEQVQQENTKHQQRAEEQEVVGRQQNDGLRDRQGGDKGNRGQ